MHSDGDAPRHSPGRTITWSTNSQSQSPCDTPAGLARTNSLTASPSLHPVFWLTYPYLCLDRLAAFLPVGMRIARMQEAHEGSHVSHSPNLVPSLASIPAQLLGRSDVVKGEYLLPPSGKDQEHAGRQTVMHAPAEVDVISEFEPPLEPMAFAGVGTATGDTQELIAPNDDETLHRFREQVCPEA